MCSSSRPRGQQASDSCNFTGVVSERPVVRWARPLANDIDTVIVDRLVAGQPVASYTTYERREAVRRLAATGIPRKVIARRLSLDSRQVYRDLEAIGAAIQRRPVSPRVAARRALIARLVAAGANTREIALLTDCSRQAVCGDRRALGCAVPGRRQRSPRPLAELRRLYGHLLDSNSQAGAA
jgi:hypothetical protein